MLGRIHSIVPSAAGYGPAARCVVHLQGCPLRCAGCPVPECWRTDGGTLLSPEELVRLVLPHAAHGVTVSGGEPLLQAAFCADFLSLLHANGIHTALDTAGYGCTAAEAERVLRWCDLVICDLKHLSDAAYRRWCGGALAPVERFLQLTAFKGVPLWLRHLVIPTLTDDPEQIRLVRDRAARCANLQNLEFIPYRKPEEQAYARLGLAFPLPHVPDMNEAWLKALLQKG